MTDATAPIATAPRERVVSMIELNALAIGLIAAIVFVFGWGLGVEPLTTLLPGFPEMRPRTAFSLIMLSVCCLLSLRATRWTLRLSSLVAAGMLVWLASLVVRYWDYQQDGVWELARIFATLASIVFGFVAMLIINLAPRFGHVAAVLAILALAPALYRILALLMLQGASDPLSQLASMGMHTAVLIVWFMGVCVLLHPRLGIVNAVFERSLRGRALRLSFPFVVLAPIATAAASLVLAQAFGWREDVLFALMAAFTVATGASLVWWLAKIIGRWQREAIEHANRLARANEALEQYASSAAHDLRAPARHVLIYGELLDEAVRKGDIAAMQSLSDKMLAAAGEIPVIIDGMLDFARSGFSRVKPRINALGEIVQAAVSLQQADIKAAGARVSVKRQADLWCDGQLMTTVFQNLFANSLKHRRGDRPLVITVEATAAAEGWRISVTDNGEGFDPKFAAVAFNPMARGVKMASGGAGIGLATCRTIMSSHGGDIRVDPTYTDGARIELTLPARVKPAKGAKRSA